MIAAPSTYQCAMPPREAAERLVPELFFRLVVFFAITCLLPGTVQRSLEDMVTEPWKAQCPAETGSCACLPDLARAAGGARATANLAATDSPVTGLWSDAASAASFWPFAKSATSGNCPVEHGH